MSVVSLSRCRRPVSLSPHLPVVVYLAVIPIPPSIHPPHRLRFIRARHIQTRHGKQKRVGIPNDSPGVKADWLGLMDAVSGPGTLRGLGHDSCYADWSGRFDYKPARTSKGCMPTYLIEAPHDNHHKRSHHSSQHTRRVYHRQVPHFH